MYDEDKQKKQTEALQLRQFVQFLARNKRWWLIPMLIVFGMVALLIVLSWMGSSEPMSTKL
ncbi:MAG: hypothetical protein IH899_22160 [Planctomycetes bacterium]|nr:hypothetical protein [Planctomycetota bacterium]